MVLDLVIIGVAITLGPLHNTAFILLLSSPKGVRKGLAFILAWLANLVALVAVVLLFTGGKPPAHKSAPSTAVLAVKLALGLGMVLYGEHKRHQGVRHRKSPKWMARLDQVGTWTAAGFGVLLQPWATVAAGAATVVQAHLSSLGSYLALMGYVLLATSSLLVMEVYATFRPEAAHTKLAGLRGWIDGHQDQAVVTLSLGLGLWLVGKSIYELV
jgi:hypothetical protein